MARKDLDTAVSLSLLVSRLEEVRSPLLSSLQAALPVVGDGLQALTALGEGQLFMWRLLQSAEEARKRYVWDIGAVQSVCVSGVA